MFSRNQIWKTIQRSNSKENLPLVHLEGRENTIHNGTFNDDNENETTNLTSSSLSSSSSSTTTSTSSPSTLSIKRNPSNDKILNILPKKEINNKQVRFSETCRVVLIPCLKEYRSLGLHLDMWWQEKDYRSFKISATQEISNFLSLFGGDVKAITRSLYQPDSAKMSLIGMDT